MILQGKASAFLPTSLHLQQEKSYLVYPLKLFMPLSVKLAEEEGSAPPPTARVKFAFSSHPVSQLGLPFLQELG